MADEIVRALAYQGDVRVSAVVCTEAVEEARKRHQCSPTAIAALGRTMAGTLLLSWGLKGEGSITLRIFGEGVLGGVIVTANADNEVRGYVQEPQADLPLSAQGKLDVGGAIGRGELYIAKDIGLGEPYTGSIPLVTGEIGDDIASYLMISEQTPSVVAVGVLVGTDYHVAAAGGIILQAMPGAAEEVLDDLEEKLRHVQPVSSLIAAGTDAQGLIAHYLQGADIQYLEGHHVQWHCHCDRERISGLLKSLGKTELTDILHHEGQSEVVCHFCNERYLFSENEIIEILAEMEQESSS